MKIEIFDKPIKTTGYFRDLDIGDILKGRDSALVFIRLKYELEDEWFYTLELIELDDIPGTYDSAWIWESDWYEGEEYVEFLGWMDDIRILSSPSTKDFYEKIKNFNRKDVK